MIGIGISTTPNRTVLDPNKWSGFIPPGAKLVVENDEHFTGVAATKNRLLAQLDTCDDIFLFDDDTWPTSEGWWLPYINSGESHLMYQFKLPGRRYGDMRLLYAGEKVNAYSHTRGAMIYIKRGVLDVVGGMDEAYKFGYEHTDWTNRIYNAGLTTFRAMDVVNSNQLIYCLDQNSKAESSISLKERRASMINNYKTYQRSKTSREYKEYK